MTAEPIEAAPTVLASHAVALDRMALDSAASRLFLRFLYRPPVGHTLADLMRVGYWNKARSFGIDAWSEIHAIVAPDGTPDGAEVARLMVLEAPSEATKDVTVGLVDRHKVTRAAKGGGR